MPNLQVDDVNSTLCRVESQAAFPWWMTLHEFLAGLPSSRFSNDMTPTASLPLLVPTPIVSPAERSPMGLGFPAESYRVESGQETS